MTITEEKYIEALKSVSIISVIRFWAIISSEDDKDLRKRGKELIQDVIRIEGRDKVLSWIRDADKLIGGDPTDLSNVL